MRMGSPIDGKRINIEHPIRHLKDRLEFVKKIHDTLVSPTERLRKDEHVKIAKEKIHQYETAIEILQEYHDGEADR